MIKHWVVILSTFVSPAVAQAQSVDAGHSIASLKWLNGEWQQHNGQRISYERWKVVNDTLMLGSSGLINGKDTTEEEAIQLIAAGIKYRTYLPFTTRTMGCWYRLGWNLPQPIVLFS